MDYTAQEKEYFMREALKEAEKSLAKEEIPIGCVIVKEGKIIGRGHNAREELQQAIMHAEIMAIKEANGMVDWQQWPRALRVREPEALAEFKGVGRRFQRYGEVALPNGGTATVIDDYGHHPVEMAATIAAARGAFPDKRLMLAFQPHRYTRTRDCFEDFVKVLSTVDALLLGEVYAAGESPIVAADGRSLARALRVAGKIEPVFVENIDDMPGAILSAAQDGDVVITMGAGSIGGVPGKLVNGEV